VGNNKFIRGNFDECLRQNFNTASSHRIIRPRIKTIGIVGKPIRRKSGSAFSITLKPSL
jgi:hypothetical protein